jgi:hypothetical protein
MRQYMRERQESRSTSTVAHMMAPVHVTVGTATGKCVVTSPENNITVDTLSKLGKTRCADVH